MEALLYDRPIEDDVIVTLDDEVVLGDEDLVRSHFEALLPDIAGEPALVP